MSQNVKSGGHGLAPNDNGGVIPALRALPTKSAYTSTPRDLMGRTKRSTMTPTTPRMQGEGPSASIHSYLHTPGLLASHHEASNMAPSSPGSTVSEDSLLTAAGPRDQGNPTPDWYALFTSLPKKEDLQSIVQEVKTTLRTEIASLSTSLQDLEGRVTALENAGPTMQVHHPNHSYDRQLTDLPPEARLYIDRVHRALRPKPPPLAPSQDVICYIQDTQLKEDIMKEARRERSWRYKGQTVELYNDLSHLTLQTRRALRPITTLLQGDQIRYRWHFLFTLTARNDNIEASIRLPADVPILLNTLRLPATPVMDWTDCTLNERYLGRPVALVLGADGLVGDTVPPHQGSHEE
ncbi:Hypothetical predicted protein [Pelobates cultripes]|uniref:Uncharacterized protein n=1 Tax=Pelobates cultripes TaxID=61616 RepID=A0AAD1SS40_PELCU|nr:Hypothetical predicted protein [Pelobates cultripes]